METETDFNCQTNQLIVHGLARAADSYSVFQEVPPSWKIKVEMKGAKHKYANKQQQQ
jgi:hypothetical protein